MKNIRHFDNVEPQLGARVYIDETAVVIGKVTIADDSAIWPMTVVRGDINFITIGARTNIQDGSILHVNHDSQYYPGGSQLKIGNDVTVGHRVTLHGCIIHDACLIGMGSTILDDAILHSGVLLGAASLVPAGKQLEGGYLWMGSPVKKIRELTEQEKKFFLYSAAHYVKVKDKYLLSQKNKF